MHIGRSRHAAALFKYLKSLQEAAAMTDIIPVSKNLLIGSAMRSVYILYYKYSNC